jgi:hypothetical protein
MVHIFNTTSNNNNVDNCCDDLGSPAVGDPVVGSPVLPPPEPPAEPAFWYFAMALPAFMELDVATYGVYTTKNILTYDGNPITLTVQQNPAPCECTTTVPNATVSTIGNDTLVPYQLLTVGHWFGDLIIYIQPGEYIEIMVLQWGDGVISDIVFKIDIPDLDPSKIDFLDLTLANNTQFVTDILADPQFAGLSLLEFYNINGRYDPAEQILI